MHYGAGESRRLQKAAALFAEDHIVGGSVLGRAGEQTGLQFLPATRSGTRPGRLLGALPEQRGRIQRLEHPYVPSSHLPAAAERFVNIQQGLTPEEGVSETTFKNIEQNLQLATAFKLFSKKAFPPHVSPGSFCIACPSRWQQLQPWRGRLQKYICNANYRQRPSAGASTGLMTRYLWAQRLNLQHD